MKPIDQIIEELQQIGIDIPEFIQSGKPENVKAANHRSLETRMNNAILDLVQHIKDLDGDRNVIVGEDDPNDTPPVGAIVGSLYLQKNADGDNLALYINTGTTEVGWFLFREYTEESKIYGDAPNPNFDSISGKVGDLYIQTNDGTSTGDILSVWMYIGLAIGDLWFNISEPSGSFNITTKTLTDGQVYNFPAMEKGEAFIVKIIDENTIPAPSGAVWLGGFGGVLAGDGSMVICLHTNAGGSYNDVGHNFAIINQGKDAEILFVDELPDEADARVGVIYVINATNAMYIWNVSTGDYELVGDVIPGTLISATVFHDEHNNPVVPSANKLYFDGVSEQYYRWNGQQFVLLNQADNEIIFTVEEAVQGLENKLYINLLTGSMKVFHAGAWVDLSIRNLRPINTGVEVKGSVNFKENQLTPILNELYRVDSSLRYKDADGRVHRLNDEKWIIPLSAFEADIQIGVTQPIIATFPFLIMDVQATAFPVPVGGSGIKLSLRKNGSVISTTDINIPSNQNNSTSNPAITLSDNQFSIGDRLDANVIEVGTSSTGENLNLILTIIKL